jgi:hypothetical protein
MQTLQLTRYAEENQLAYTKASKSSAIFDCVVVIPDMFDAAVLLCQHKVTKIFS